MQLRAGGDQIFGQGGAFKKAESRTGMEFDEHRPWLEGALLFAICSPNSLAGRKEIVKPANVPN